MTINKDALCYALSIMLKQDVLEVSYKVSILQGGTLASVSLIEGMAEAQDGTNQPFHIVLKVQKKWERFGDPNSWRREYDLYASELTEGFSLQFRWPVCYYAQLNEVEDECQLWLEYCEGLSSSNLTGEHYEQAARELGQFQGKLYAEQATALSEGVNVSHKQLTKQTYEHYRSWPLVFCYIRSEACELPAHLSDMLISLDEQADHLFAKLEQLPTVLCHRDFWVNNIICRDETVIAIDWDTTGWGYMGEDIASLIVDEADIEHIPYYYERCITAYYNGFMATSGLEETSELNFDSLYHACSQLMLIMFGYKFVEMFVTSEEQEEKDEVVAILQGIYDIQQVK